MISIIAGKYKGKKLYHFNNLHVRPTQAKIRKSIFQILEPFDNLDVLDLYAGVGTLGYESISRGARSIVFVEKDKRVFKILKKNISLFEEEKMTLCLSDVMKFVSKINEDRFDIIFADPPYKLSNFNLLCEKIKNHLKPNGIFCMEMKKQDINMSNLRIQYYGNTQVVFWKANT